MPYELLLFDKVSEVLVREIGPKIEPSPSDIMSTFRLRSLEVAMSVHVVGRARLQKLLPWFEISSIDLDRCDCQLIFSAP